MTRRSLFACVALPALAARRDELPAFPDWNEKIIDRILTDSPWARPLAIRFRQPFKTAAGAAGSVETEANLIVRWASALPVRQATALALGLQTRTAKRLLATEQPAEYIIEAAGFSASAIAGGPAALRQALLDSARLIDGGTTRRAHSVDVPEHGTHLIAEIRFPADPAITGEPSLIEFTASAGTLQIRCKFQPANMRYQGHLAL